MIPLRGEIYWANLEPVKGSEQGGSRPVLVVSNTIVKPILLSKIFYDIKNHTANI